MKIDAKKCPICNQDNQCGNELNKSTCWCASESFPEGIFSLVPEEKLRQACICKDCLEEYKTRIGV